MPKGTKRKRAASTTYRRRLYKPVVSTSSTLTRQHRILNTTQNVVLRYSDRRLITAGAAGTAAGYVFNCNGLYDVNHTGVGTQPRGFDQLMTMYDHYYVTEAVCEVWFCNAVSAPLIGSIVVRDGTSLDLTYQDVLEDAYATHTTIKPNDSEQNGYARFCVNVPKFLGRPMKDDVLVGGATTNPAEQAHFHIYLNTVDSTITPAAYFIVKITFNTTLIEPKQPVAS
ncbi:MAG: putative capsid protein [Circoviridae sp.]|nr:MAG: putative capsid protein [Circoviridae sp.]